MAETTGAIYEAMPRVMKRVGHVGKNRKNEKQGYAFRGIDDVVAACQEVMAEEGVTVVPAVRQFQSEVFEAKAGGRMVRMVLLVDHTFFAKDGSSMTATTLGEAMDTGDKSANKAMSAAMKYALVESLCIPTHEADRDTEQSSPEIASPQARPAVVSGKTAVAVAKAALPPRKLVVPTAAKPTPPGNGWPPDYQPPEPPPHADEDAPF